MGLTTFEHVRTEQSAFTYTSDEYQGEIVPYGICHLDSNFVMGVKPTSPQLNVIQGGTGARKTTLMFNLIINMCLSGNLPPGHKIVYDSLENGMTLERSAIVLRAILASKYMIYSHYVGYRDILVDENPIDYLKLLFTKELPPITSDKLLEGITTVYSGKTVPQCVLTPDFIEAWYMGRVIMTPLQTKAWMIAGDTLGQFPIEFFGISEHPNWDIAEKRSTVTTNIEQSYERWCKISEECNSVQIITDYLQEYWLPNSSDHYQKQLTITPWISRFIKEKRKTVWVLSQEGIQHQRDFQSKGMVLGSSGGDVLKAASQNNWRVSYDGDRTPYCLILHAPVKSRRGRHPDLELMIEPNSGAIFGKSKIKTR